LSFSTIYAKQKNVDRQSSAHHALVIKKLTACFLHSAAVCY